MDKTYDHETAKSTTRILPDARSARRTFAKPGEVLILAGGLLVIAILAVTILGKLTLTRDIADARTVSDKTIANIQKRNGSAVRALGSAKFQATYTSTELTQDFNSIQIATLKPPKLDRQFVTDVPSGRTMLFIYKYTALKVPYYIRTTVRNESGQWRLTSISGSIDENKLLGG